MPKIALLVIVLPMLIAPFSPILAQETASSTEAVNSTFKLPKTPLDGLINEWFGGGKLKDTVQQGMDQAQAGLKDAAGQAVGTAKTAAKDEINRQADLAVQRLKVKAEAYVGEVVAIIKNNISEIISNIKTFFVDLFKKPAPTV